MQAFPLAPWDRKTKWATWGVILFQVLMLIGFAVLDRYFPLEPVMDLILLSVIVILFLCYAFSPQVYLVDDKGITIERIGGPIFIPHEEINSVAIVEKPIKYKLIGSEGFFGYYGTFQSAQRRQVKVYATRLEKMVEIKTAKHTYYLTPRDVDDFLAALEPRQQVRQHG